MKQTAANTVSDYHAMRTVLGCALAVTTLAMCNSPSTTSDAAAHASSAPSSSSPLVSGSWRDDFQRPSSKVDHELGSFGAASTFDLGDAMKALALVAQRISECKRTDGPTGTGHVKVTFVPVGTVSHVEIDGGPFETASAVTACVAARFAATRVTSFTGEPVTVRRAFSID